MHLITLNNTVKIFVYVLLITTNLLIAQEILFEQHIVDNTFIDGYDVSASDLDQDGDADILACRKGNGGEVCWYMNNGTSQFTKFPIKQNFTSVRSVRAADLNNDQEIDIVCAAWQINDIIYFENIGDEVFVEHMVDDNFKGAHTIDLKDINGDGNIDILCSGWDYYGKNGEIAWWENDGQDSITWTKHLISDRFQQSPFIYGEDMDNDGDIDVIACGEENDEILWWENDGSGEFISEYMIDPALYGAHTVIARDVDSDGDMDILGAAYSSSTIVWYENNGNQEFEKHNLPYLPGALWLDAVDLDNDGDNDLIAAGMNSSFLYWYENDGNQEFTKYSIDGGFNSGFSIVPVNMDNDGDIDLLAVGRFSNKISWFENNLDTIVWINQHHNETESKIFVYPNPCSQFVNIVTGNHGEQKQISIYDQKGQLIKSCLSTEKSTKLNMLNTNNGVYNIQIEYEDRTTSSTKLILKK